MPFELNHWRNPRATIANRFQNNDIAYATHGAVIAMEALNAIDLPASQLRNLTLLDYGCGTGRSARVLSKIFAKVIAYDPVEECIQLAKNECPGMEFPNVVYTSNLDEVPKCDMAISINVIEHLTHADAVAMMNNLREKVSGKSYIWYFAKRNGWMLEPYMDKEWSLEDQKLAEGTDDRMLIRGFQFS